MKKDIPGIREFFQWLYDAENGDTASFVGQGLYHAPLALAEITRHVSEPQPRLEYGLKSLKHLDLCNNMIRGLDPFLADLTNLRSLKADGNRLERLPEFFKYYTRLGYLSISHNRITMFPPETGAMLSVRTIIAHNNEIDSLVDGFARLSTLRNLELSHNRFR
jgi:Leucine-rich repeat (LRR) protein